MKERALDTRIKKLLNLLEKKKFDSEKDRSRLHLATVKLKSIQKSPVDLKSRAKSFQGSESINQDIENRKALKTHIQNAKKYFSELESATGSKELKQEATSSLKMLSAFEEKLNLLIAQYDSPKHVEALHHPHLKQAAKQLMTLVEMIDQKKIKLSESDQSPFLLHLYSCVNVLVQIDDLDHTLNGNIEALLRTKRHHHTLKKQHNGMLEAQKVLDHHLDATQWPKLNKTAEAILATIVSEIKAYQKAFEMSLKTLDERIESDVKREREIVIDLYFNTDFRVQKFFNNTRQIVNCLNRLLISYAPGTPLYSLYYRFFAKAAPLKPSEREQLDKQITLFGLYEKELSEINKRKAPFNDFLFHLGDKHPEAKKEALFNSFWHSSKFYKLTSKVADSLCRMYQTLQSSGIECGGLLDQIYKLNERYKILAWQLRRLGAYYIEYRTLCSNARKLSEDSRHKDTADMPKKANIIRLFNKQTLNQAKLNNLPEEYTPQELRITHFPTL